MLTGGRPLVAQSLLTLAAVTAGLVGAARLARRAGASSGAGQVAGWVYIGGAAIAALLDAGLWPLLLAAGPLPWALDAVIAPGASTWKRRLGRVARGGLAAGLTAMAYPPLLLIVPIVGLLWAVVAGRRAAALIGVMVAALGAGLIAPYVVAGDLSTLLGSSELPGINPVWVWPVSVGVACAVAVWLVSPTRLAGVALGGLLASIGWLAGRAPGVSPGVGIVGLLTAGVGGALLAAALVDVDSRHVWQRLVGWAAAALLLVPAAFTVAGGRAGLPPDQFTNALAFVETLAGDREPGRVLLIGPAAALPGMGRSIGGIDYRLVDGGVATLDQAYLPAPAAGDAAFAAAFERAFLLGVDLRPGEAMAAFGVRWVVILPGAELDLDVLERQVDLAERPLDPDVTVFENVAPGGRAIAADGTEWLWEGNGYGGDPTATRVRLADNSNSNWGPGWLADSWASSVDGSEGAAFYRSDPLARAAGIAALVLAVTLGGAAWWGRADVRGGPEPALRTSDTVTVEAGV
jgi:hypothetical protein